MKRSHPPSLSPLVLTALLFGAPSCGLQEHPRHSQDPGASDPGDPVVPPVIPPAAPGATSPTPSPTPPAPGSPAPAPAPPGAMQPPPGTNPPGPGPTPPGASPTPTPNPSGGPGVTIAGVFVPREKAIVIIHWGHSNMYGHGVNPPEMRPYFFNTVPGLWSYKGAGRFAPAKEKTAPSIEGDMGNDGGPGMAILHALQAAAPPDQGYQFISIGRAQGSAHTDQFLKGGLYYSTFMDLALQLKGKVTFGGMFIMMGITDRHMPLNEQGGFADRMTKIVADIRADLGEPNLPVLHTDYEVTATGTLALNTDFARRIRPLMLSLPDRIPNLALVPTDAIPLEDDHHFTFAGHKIWSDRSVDIMKMRGWLPWQAR